MSEDKINLKILLPFGLFATALGVSRIVAETSAGSMGILPHRLDFVSAITPGILIYEIREEGETYVAVDQGVIVKTGRDVFVSVRNAIGGADLDQLYDTVEREFTVLDEREQNVRLVMSKMESSFVRRIAEFGNE